VFRSCILILLSKTQRFERSLDKLLEACKSRRLIGKQIQVRLRVFGDLDRPIVNTIIYPVRGDVKGFGKLRDRERTSHMPRMGLTAHLELPMPQANDLDGAWQDERVHRRAIALPREFLCDHLVGCPLPHCVGG
jgi:hypothetical protein